MVVVYIAELKAIIINARCVRAQPAGTYTRSTYIATRHSGRYRHLGTQVNIEPCMHHVQYENYSKLAKTHMHGHHLPGDNRLLLGLHAVVTKKRCRRGML